MPTSKGLHFVHMEKKRQKPYLEKLGGRPVFLKGHGGRGGLRWMTAKTEVDNKMQVALEKELQLRGTGTRWSSEKSKEEKRNNCPKAVGGGTPMGERTKGEAFSTRLRAESVGGKGKTNGENVCEGKPLTCLRKKFEG